MVQKNQYRVQNEPTPTIVGAGITEQYYFQHIQSIFGYYFKLKPRFFGTENLHQIEKKISEIISGNGIAICVFDTDVADRDPKEKKKLERLLKKYSKNKDVVFCDSLPSIEYWFLLHYANKNRHFNNSHDLINELQKFIAKYAKSEKFLENIKWVSDLCAENKLEVAIERSENFINKNGSYSNIFKAFEYLKRSKTTR